MINLNTEINIQISNYNPYIHWLQRSIYIINVVKYPA